jgi:peptidoglycan/LPS O-acetylase OafA/YrhL
LENNGTELRVRTAGSRYLELDGLRGLAAFTVIWHHFGLMFGLPEVWYLRPLLAGKSAVLLFFVLSGFVLSLPFWNSGSTGRYRSYLTRRFFRIYVPFAAAVVISALGAKLFGQHELPLGRFYHLTWQVPVTPKLIFSHLMMGPGHELNNALWTIRTEVQMSIVFPLLLLFVRVLGPAITMPIACALVIAGGHYIAKGAPNPYLYLDTLEYGGMFLLGALIAQKRVELHGLWSKSPKLLRGAFFALSAVLYWSNVDGLCHRFHLPQPLAFSPLLGACGLLVCAIHATWFRRTLQSSVPQYLGRVSYSLYLLHEPVLYAVTICCFGRSPLIVLAAIYGALAMSIAHLFCLSIEEPSLRLGKRLATKRNASNTTMSCKISSSERQTESLVQG